MEREWHADERFWRDLYPYMFKPEVYELAKEQVDQVLALSGCESGKVLDLCSGPGRHSVLLAGRGFEVTGVDRTRFLMDKAKAFAEEAGVRVEWVEADMRQFRRENAFDLVLNLFTSFGYFEDGAEDRMVLEHVLASLRPGGTFMMQLMSRERLAKIFLETSSEAFPDGTLLVQRRWVVKDWTAIANDWMLVRGGQVEHYPFEHRVYAGSELRTLLEKVGFRDVQLFGGLDGRPYDTEALYLVAVARRGE